MATMETGCCDYDACEMNVDKETEDKVPRNNELRLVFEATQSQPDFAKLFLASGGALNTAAGPSETDLALTASKKCAYARLSAIDATEFHMRIPDEMIVRHDDTSVTLNSELKLNVNSNRIGSAINGVIVDTHAGSGAVYVSHLLTNKKSHTLVPCTYNMLMSHACTLGISNVRIMRSNDGFVTDEEVDVIFEKDEESANILSKAERALDELANDAWNMRQKLVYAPSPTLTKSVAKVPVGINGTGFSPVHDIISGPFPFGMPALNSLFEATIGMELEFDEENIQKLRDSTQEPGLRASNWAQTIAAATSVAVNYLIAYRADGRTVIGANGSEFVATESWRKIHKPTAGDDCDGGALIAVSMINAAIESNEADDFPYLKVVKNVVHPYYQIGVGVVGATAGQANAADASKQHVVGHAIAMMVPTLSMLDGLDRGATNHTVDGRSLLAGTGVSAAKDLARMRLEALFPEHVLATLPSEESTKLISGNIAEWESAKRLKPYAIEGTTPAIPIFEITDSHKRNAMLEGAQRDTQAFNAAAPTVGRGIKVLLGKFYHDVVEFSLASNTPLYTDAKLREAGHASTQFVFANPSSRDLVRAGATPKDLVTGEYALVPLHTVDSIKSAMLDVASEAANADVMPPRGEPMRLSEYESTNLKRSISALEKLGSALPDEHSTGHCVAYILSYSSLVNNTLAIEHFADRIKSSSVAGVVDFSMIKGLATYADGAEAGHFVVVNAVVEI